MSYQLQNGVFSLDTYVTRSGRTEHIVISLDLGHSEIAEMLSQAINSKGRQARRANGALTIRAVGQRQLSDTPAPPDPADDWEGPQHPEYPEHDQEALDEMEREDAAGKS